MLSQKELCVPMLILNHYTTLMSRAISKPWALLMSRPKQVIIEMETKMDN